MPATAPLPPQAQLQALAHAALLDQLDRDDPAYAQAALVDGLARATGRRAWLEASACDSPCHADDGSLALPLQRLDTPLGRLCLRPGDDLAPDSAAAALVAITDTLAALLLAGRSARHAGTGGGTGGALIRAALRGAGTFVWEWHIPSDRLGDIDEGFDALGRPRQGQPGTQQDWDALIHPDDRAANHAAYLRHAAGESALYEHEYRALDGSGGWRWLQERGRVVEWAADGAPLRMVGVQSDITERRAAEEAAREATERLGRIASHVPGALYQYHYDGARGHACFPYISERCATLFGIPASVLEQDAEPLMACIDASQLEAVRAAGRRSLETMGPWVQEFRMQRPDGTVRWIRGCSTPQRVPDGSVMWHGYFEDVTEWHALARADHGQRLAEAANRAKNEFLSRMSHELRTPLNAVLGFAQLMALDEAAPLPPDQARRLALIRQSGEHLLAMIEDLLDLTSIEAGRLPLAMETVRLRPLADDALAMVQAAARRQDLRLSCEGDATLQAWADRKRLRQVLINLLSNAVKYNRPGGRVLVRLLAAGGQARVEVHDTGPGLSAEDCARLFEPFNRLGQANGPVEGTGIGLAVTQSLVRLMHGQIDVQSTPGAGSCFSVMLPMRAPAAAPADAAQGTSLP